MDLRQANNILLCLRWGIGDVVIQTALLWPLRRYLREARITVLGAAPAMDLLERDERVTAVVRTQAFGITHYFDEGDERCHAKVREWLDAARFDAVLDPHVSPPAVSSMIWDRHSSIWESDQRAEEAVLREGGDAVAALLAGARSGWGLPITGEARPMLWFGAEDRRRAAALCAALAGAVRPIAIAPFASHPLKRWPAERFAAIADDLARDGETVLLMDSPDSDAAAVAEEAMTRRAVIVEPQPLRVTAALLAQCRLLLANDTGLMHMAAAVGTPTIGVFGPSNSVAYGPHGAHGVSVIDDTASCPWQRRGTLQPPDCWTSDRCLIGLRSCIDGVGEDIVRDAVRERLGVRALSSAAARRSGTRVASLPQGTVQQERGAGDGGINARGKSA